MDHIQKMEDRARFEACQSPVKFDLLFCEKLSASAAIQLLLQSVSCEHSAPSDTWSAGGHHALQSLGNKDYHCNALVVPREVGICSEGFLEFS